MGCSFHIGLESFHLLVMVAFQGFFWEFASCCGAAMGAESLKSMGSVAGYTCHAVSIIRPSSVPEAGVKVLAVTPA